MTNTAPPSTLGDIVTEIETLEREERRLQARRYRLLAQAIDVTAREVELERAQGFERKDRVLEETLAYRSLRAEVATAMHVSEITASTLLSHAHALVRQYPTAHAHLEAGHIGAQHTKVIVESGEVISPVQSLSIGVEQTEEVKSSRAEYEARVLAHAAETTTHRLRPIAKRIAEEYAETSLDERFERERQYRAVWVTPRENGMAEVGAYLQADLAYAIHSRLTEIAKQIQQAETAASTAPDPTSASPMPRRTRNEVRADVFADLLLGGTPGDASGAAEPVLERAVMVRGIVQVVVPGDALVTSETFTQSRSQAPAQSPAPAPSPSLEGYGPIPHSIACEVAALTPVWDRVTTDSITGTVLKVDRYRPSEEMKRYLMARDQHCRFPGCRVPAHRCDLDHTVDAAKGGETSTANLGALCRGHHMLKHHGGWQVTQLDDGVYEWRSSTGRTHVDRPPGLFAPRQGAAREQARGAPSRVRFEPVPASG